MRIETEEWLPFADAWPGTGMSESAARRLGRDLGLLETFFGVLVLRRRDVATLRENRRTSGNPRWIADGDAASADGAMGTPAREAKKKRKA